MCAVMIAATSASIAARNGTSSTASMRSGAMLDERQLVVRVGARVAMAGKVLAARRDPRPLQRRDDPSPEPGDVVGSVGERAIADDGILRVGEDVEDRRVVERDADRLELGGQGPREALGERVVAAAAERHHRRPHGERRLQPRDPAALLIDAHPQRQLVRQRLRLARDLGHLIRRHDVAREQDDRRRDRTRARASGDPTECSRPANPAIAS